MRSGTLVYCVLLVIGLVGGALTAWALAGTSRSRRMPERLGLDRVADRWDHVLDLLGLPALVLWAVLVVWSTFELYRRWRATIRIKAARPPGRPRRGARPAMGDTSTSPRKLRLPGPD